MVDLSVLSDHAKDAQGWSPITMETLAGPDVEVLAYDQSLSATGMVVLSRVSDYVSVLTSHTSRLRSGSQDSFVQDYEKAMHLEDIVEYDLANNVWMGQVKIAFEKPPVVNAQMLRKSPNAGKPALICGQAIWSVARRCGIPVEMVHSQKGRSLICGKAKGVDKKAGHEVLKRDVLPWLPGSEKITNESHRDALMVGLVVLANAGHQ